MENMMISTHYYNEKDEMTLLDESFRSMEKSKAFAKNKSIETGLEHVAESINKYEETIQYYAYKNGELIFSDDKRE